MLEVGKFIPSSLPKPSESAMANLNAIDAIIRAQPQIDMPTLHVLHAGMYARTVLVPAGCTIASVLIKIPTIVVFNGDANVTMGDTFARFVGCHVFMGEAGRKQVIEAIADTYLTMSFPTSATTVAEAEAEFTDEVDMLMSNTNDNVLLQVQP